MISEKDQAKPLDKTAIKCRFFGQYFEQIIAKETKYPNSPTINTTTVLLINELSNYHLELKPLSKITDEDAGKIPYRNSSDNIIGYYTAKSLNKNIESIGFYTNEEIDNLRLLGYAVPFMEYSVDDLVSFGWVRLV